MGFLFDELAERSLRFVRMSVDRTAVRMAFFSALALAVTFPLLTTAGMFNDFRDAHVLFHYEDVAVKTVRQFQQWPLWDPYYCGGMYLLGTPQSRFVSPNFVLSLLFGTARGEALSAYLMTVVALEGTFRWLRQQSESALAALLAAPIFAWSGVFAGAAVFGWTNFYGFALVPWVLLGFTRGLQGSRRGMVLFAASMAWMIGFAGTYAAPMTALLCGFYGLRALFERRPIRDQVPGLLGRAVTMPVFAVGLSAIKLLPVLDTMIVAPRIMRGTPGNPWASLGRAFWGGHLLRAFDAGWSEREGPFYAGVVWFPLALLGCFQRRSLPHLALALACAWLSFGYAVTPSLFGALRALPVFDTFRYPERFLIFAALGGATLSARGFARLLVVARTKWRTAALLLAAFALCLNAAMLVQNRYAAAAARSLVPLPTEMHQEFRQTRGNRWLLAYYAPLDRGSLSCWDAYPVPQSSALRGDRESEVELADPAAGRVHLTRWSPNQMELDVDAQVATEVRVNQNWHSGWRATGGDVHSSDGLLAISVPSGTRHVHLEFSPHSARSGAILFLATCALLAVMYRQRRRKHIEYLAAFALAVLCVVLSCATGVPRKPSKTTPTGEAVLLQEPPPEAPHVGAHFAEGIELVAASTRETLEHGVRMVRVDLYWRTGGGVEAGLSAFVHMEGEGRRLLTQSDHTLLSSSVELDRVPAGEIVRDEVFLLPPDGQPFKIWAGLWRPREGSRVPVSAAAGVQLSADRVLVGEGGAPDAGLP